MANPDAAAISATVALWKPLAAKTFTAASRISDRRMLNSRSLRFAFSIVNPGFPSMKGRSFYEWRFTVPSKSPFVKKKDDPKLRPDRHDGDGPDGSGGKATAGMRSGN